MNIELNESNDNFDKIRECAKNDEFKTDETFDQPDFFGMQKAIQKNNNYYYKLGILNALDDAVLKINMVDGKPQFQIRYFCESVNYSVTKTLSHQSIWTDRESSCNLTLRLKDTNVTFIPEGDVEPEIQE